jgi:hypothetical protein
MCPSMPTPHYAAFPSDGFKLDGLSVHDAEAYSGVTRRLTIWGGTIASITGPSHAGPTGGNSTGQFTVRFNSTGSAVLLAWGGHLAQSRYWNMANGGPRDGAGEVSGAPWHMRTLNLDGAGARNQDRSIQPSAIVGELPPFALAPPTPTPRPPISRAVVTPRPTNGGGGPGAPIDPPVPTAPATSTAGSPVSTAPGVRWEVVALLALLAAGGFATALARVRGPGGSDRRRS